MSEYKIFITGDYCPIGRNAQTIGQGEFATLFGGFENYSRSADLAITNLECPLTNSNNPIQKTGPNIKSSLNNIQPLKYAGFGLVTLANNHIMDYGPEGLQSTMEVCNKEGINYVGAGRNLDEARKPFYQNIKGKTVAILNIAENEFCTTTGEEPGANPLNTITNYYDIKEAKKHADLVILISHGGREHYNLPTPKLRERYRFFIDSGADIVVGHHTHCFSGHETYKGKNIFYSLGNFIFDYKKKYQKGLWTQGYAVLFKINDDVIDFDLIPYHQGRIDNPNLVLFDASETKVFEEKILELNTIIQNEHLFQSEWKKYIQSEKVPYKGLLLNENKYIRALKAKGIMPAIFFHSKEHQLVLLNLLKCETHREIMIDVLEESSHIYSR